MQDRTRRSLEYSIYQRELKEVGDAFEMLEEDRRRDVDNANSKRTEFNDREKEMSVRCRPLLKLGARVDDLIVVGIGDSDRFATSTTRPSSAR